ncbi:MAG: PKD domain-containing protein [Bacteroidota bacterium]
MRKYILLIIFAFFSAFATSIAQTHTDTYFIDWKTQNQNMWGPNGQVFTMDTSINLYDVDQSGITTQGYIANIFGGDFGAELTIDYWLKHGCNFVIEGFSTGSVDVDYPTKIDMTYPDDQTFNPGQTVTIQSDYTVQPGWELNSDFPHTGSVSFDMYFGFNIDVDATVCVWSCTTFDVFEVGVPLDTTHLFQISDSSGVADVFYPWYDPGIGFYMVHDTILPIVFNNLGGIGLSGTIGIPYVATDDWLDPNTKCLMAKGDSAHMAFDLDILQFLSAFDSSWAAVIGMLNGTIDLGMGISVDYSLLTAHLLATGYMVQDFSFCPTLWAHMTFPIPVDYSITDPANGNAVVGSGNSDSIIFKVDNNLNYVYPCLGPPDMNLGLKFAMDNDFHNHTWDSIAFTFTLTAFTFVIHLPSFPVMPELCIPEECLEVPVPCPEKTNEPQWCTQLICMPEVCSPEVVVNQTDQDIIIGPLIDLTIPLGYVPITWFEQTWELAGFTPDQSGQGWYDTIVPGATMIPNPPLSTDIHGPNVICYGDTVATITVTVDNGTAPFTYVWSTGDSVTSSARADSIVVSVGSYSVTVYDVNGCNSVEVHTIYFINPQIFVTLSGTDINCAGDSTGSIISYASGGSPGYTYLWTPYGGTADTATGLCAGIYTLLVTDSVGCTKTATQTLIELHPLPPVNISSDITSGCQPLNVYFKELSGNQGQTYFWDFGDGATDSIKYPMHLYTSAGSFTVSCTVVSVYGCDSTQTIPAMIIVHPKPVAAFDPNPSISKSTLDPSWTIFFLDQSQGPSSWTWDFGDGSTSDLESPSHSYSKEGVYVVLLTVETSFGCIDTASRTVQVIDDILTYPNIFTPNGDGSNDNFVIKNVEKYPENTLVIFNRWGAKVFEQYHYRNTWNAEGIADGVYYFIFDSGISEKTIEGTVTIMR